MLMDAPVNPLTVYRATLRNWKWNKAPAAIRADFEIGVVTQHAQYYADQIGARYNLPTPRILLVHSPHDPKYKPTYPYIRMEWESFWVHVTVRIQYSKKGYEYSIHRNYLPSGGIADIPIILERVYDPIIGPGLQLPGFLAEAFEDISMDVAP